MPRDGDEAATYECQITAAQLDAARSWMGDPAGLPDGPLTPVKLYRLSDASYDFHIGDDAANVDPDGTNNG